MKIAETILQIRLGKEFFGIDSDISNQILRIPPITPIPLSQESTKGIIVLNGKIVPVVDLKVILRIGSVDVNKEESRIITLKIKDEEIAILVDEVIDAINLNPSNYEENISSDDFITGFYKYDKYLIQMIEPKNIIKEEMITSFSPVKIEDMYDEEHKITKSENLNTNRYLFFKAKNEYFAIDIELVAELIFVPKEITPIAGSVSSNLGAITLREEVIDVFDFNLLFNFEKVKLKDEKTRVLILKNENKKLAICVESIEEIKDIDTSKIENIKDSFGDNKLESLYKDKKSIISIVNKSYLRDLIDKYSVSKVDVSKEEKQDNGSENMRELAVFAIGNEEFAFDIEGVQEIITYQEVTPLPESNEFVEGVINLRGSIIPVVNLPKKLGFDSNITEKSKIVVCITEGEKVGFLVDDVNDIMFIEDYFVSVSKNFENLVKSTISIDSGKRVILEIRIEKIISAEELQSMKEE